VRLLEVGEDCFLSGLCLNCREGDNAPQARARLLKKRGCSSGDGGEVHGILLLQDIFVMCGVGFTFFFLAFASAEIRRYRENFVGRYLGSSPC
jgi:hypothetical protein